MSDTLGGFGIIDIIRKGHEFLGSGSIVVRRTNGSDIFIGAVVGEVGETFPDIDLSAEGDDGFLGLVRAPVHPANDFDIDTALADNKWVYVVKPHGGLLEILAWLQAQSGGAESSKAGENMAIGDQDDGFLQPMSDKYADASVATDTQLEVVGRAVKAITGHATQTKVMELYY